MLDNHIFVKYQKYKTKYLKLKKLIGGRDIGYYIYPITESIFDPFPILNKIEKNNPTLKTIDNFIKYNNKEIFNIENEYHIIESFFTTNLKKYSFKIHIYQNINNIIKLYINNYIIEFEYFNDFDFINFKGKLKLIKIIIPEPIKELIKKEFNISDNLLAVDGFNIIFEINNLKNFMNTFIKLFINYDIINDYFFELRKRIQIFINNNTILASICQNDKIFNEFIINHYLHNLYSEVGPFKKFKLTTYYYLMSKYGFNFLIKILQHKIENDIIINDTISEKKINIFCNNKNKYNTFIMKYLKTKLNIDEIEFRNGKGEWVNLPSNLIFENNDTPPKTVSYPTSIILDSGNDAKTIIGIPIINFLGLTPSACTSREKCIGIGGESTYESMINVEIKLKYYEKIFNVECLVEKKNESLMNTFLMGWNNILTELTKNGYAIYGQK
jgi:hypothetical protein